MAEMIHSAKFR